MRNSTSKGQKLGRTAHIGDKVAVIETTRVSRLVGKAANTIWRKHTMMGTSNHIDTYVMFVVCD